MSKYSKLKFRAVCFSDGMNGMHRQEFRNDEYGINCEKYKESHKHPWVVTYSVEDLPGKIFKTGKEVIQALEKLNGGQKE